MATPRRSDAVRFVLNYARCCPAELQPGEAKRVPKDASKPVVGFYFGCPSCGRPQIILSKSIDHDRGHAFVEGASLTMTEPHVCASCKKSYTIADGEFVVSA